MNILITGNHGTGKSRMGDLLKTLIFKFDEDCTINISDDGRKIKSIGTGKNIHSISTNPIPTGEELNNADVVINILNERFNQWYEKVN